MQAPSCPSTRAPRSLVCVPHLSAAPGAGGSGSCAGDVRLCLLSQHGDSQPPLMMCWSLEPVHRLTSRSRFLCSPGPCKDGWISAMKTGVSFTPSHAKAAAAEGQGGRRQLGGEGVRGYLLGPGAASVPGELCHRSRLQTGLSSGLWWLLETTCLWLCPEASLLCPDLGRWSWPARPCTG